MFFRKRQFDKKIAKYQSELIQIHYREVENMYRQIRVRRHDYRNHIRALKFLASKQDMAAVSEYLRLHLTYDYAISLCMHNKNLQIDEIEILHKLNKRTHCIYNH